MLERCSRGRRTGTFNCTLSNCWIRFVLIWSMTRYICFMTRYICFMTWYACSICCKSIAYWGGIVIYGACCRWYKSTSAGSGCSIRSSNAVSNQESCTKTQFVFQTLWLLINAVMHQGWQKQGQLNIFNNIILLYFFAFINGMFISI